jgi:hypothetical protein
MLPVKLVNEIRVFSLLIKTSTEMTRLTLVRTPMVIEAVLSAPKRGLFSLKEASKGLSCTFQRLLSILGPYTMEDYRCDDFQCYPVPSIFLPYHCPLC